MTPFFQMWINMTLPIIHVVLDWTVEAKTLRSFQMCDPLLFSNSLSVQLLHSPWKYFSKSMFFRHFSSQETNLWANLYPRARFMREGYFVLITRSLGPLTIFQLTKWNLFNFSHCHKKLLISRKRCYIISMQAKMIEHCKFGRVKRTKFIRASLLVGFNY